VSMSLMLVSFIVMMMLFVAVLMFRFFGRAHGRS
jgi:hypothetical protein